MIENHGAAMADVIALPERLGSAYVFDMDATIYLGDHLLPGAKRLINELRRRGIPVRFLTNNPTRDPGEYATKLTHLGIPTPTSDIRNSVETTVSWLAVHHPGAAVFPIGEVPLKRALESAGFTLSEDPSQIDVVVASYDRTFDYRKLQIAFDAIWFYERAILIATNPDAFCPFPAGRGEPDCAAIVAAIEACTGTQTVANLGKPNPVMLQTALSGLDVDIADCVMVGDRLQTDARMALDAGATAAVVLTGEATPADISALPLARRPPLVLDRIDRLVPQRIWDELGWVDQDDR